MTTCDLRLATLEDRDHLPRPRTSPAAVELMPARLVFSARTLTHILYLGKIVTDVRYSTEWIRPEIYLYHSFASEPRKKVGGNTVRTVLTCGKTNDQPVTG